MRDRLREFSCRYPEKTALEFGRFGGARTQERGRSKGNLQVPGFVLIAKVPRGTSGSGGSQVATACARSSGSQGGVGGSNAQANSETGKWLAQSAPLFRLPRGADQQPGAERVSYHVLVLCIGSMSAQPKSKSAWTRMPKLAASSLPPPRVLHPCRVWRSRQTPRGRSRVRIGSLRLCGGLSNGRPYANITAPLLMPTCKRRRGWKRSMWLLQPPRLSGDDGPLQQLQ